MVGSKDILKLILVITSIPLIIFAQIKKVENFNPEKFLDEVQQNYKSFENFVVEFTKEVSSPAISGKQISNGKLYYLNQNKYRLEIDEQLIISDGQTIYNYSKKAKRVVVTNFEENFFSPQNLLTNVPQNYKKEFLGEENLGNKKAFKFRFYPSSSNPEFKTMIVWLTSNKIIQKIQVEDWAGNLYTIETKIFSSNQPIKEDLIKFKIPSGVKVVDLR